MSLLLMLAISSGGRSCERRESEAERSKPTEPPASRCSLLCLSLAQQQTNRANPCVHLRQASARVCKREGGASERGGALITPAVARTQTPTGRHPLCSCRLARVLRAASLHCRCPLCRMIIAYEADRACSCVLWPCSHCLPLQSILLIVESGFVVRLLSSPRFLPRSSLLSSPSRWVAVWIASRHFHGCACCASSAPLADSPSVSSQPQTHAARQLALYSKTSAPGVHGCMACVLYSLLVATAAADVALPFVVARVLLLCFQLRWVCTS